MEIWQQTKFCCSVKEQCIFVDLSLLQIKYKFHGQESVIMHEVSAYERVWTKEKFNFQKCRVRLRESVRFNTVMCKYRVWLGGKTGNWKGTRK